MLNSNKYQNLKGVYTNMKDSKHHDMYTAAIVPDPPAVDLLLTIDW